MKLEQMGLGAWSQAPEQREGPQDLGQRCQEGKKVQGEKKELSLGCTEDRKRWRGGLWSSERGARPRPRVEARVRAQE